MNIDKYVFAQLVPFLDRSKFNRIVKKYDRDKYVKSFTCWNQLLVMMFAQLTKQDSLRTTSLSIESLGTMCYHLGFGKGVTRSNLSKANQERDYHIFEEFAYFVVNEAREKRVTDLLNLDGNVYAFDSTTVDLCLSVFWWAAFRKHKGGIKIHTLYDIETQRRSERSFTGMTNRRESLPSSRMQLKFLHLRSPIYIKTDGRWSFSSNGLNNIFESRNSGALMRMLLEFRSILQLLPTVW